VASGNEVVDNYLFAVTVDVQVAHCQAYLREIDGLYVFQAGGEILLYDLQDLYYATLTLSRAKLSIDLGDRLIHI
jgi:hypothetical protein